MTALSMGRLPSGSTPSVAHGRKPWPIVAGSWRAFVLVVQQPQWFEALDDRPFLPAASSNRAPSATQLENATRMSTVLRSCTTLSLLGMPFQLTQIHPTSSFNPLSSVWTVSQGISHGNFTSDIENWEFAAGYGSDGETRTEDPTPSKAAAKKPRASLKAKINAVAP